MEKIKVLQVGVWDRTHSDHVMMSMRSMPQFYEVVGICEPDEEQKARALKRDTYNGLQWFTLEEALNADVDAVIIETSELTQAKTALPFARMGKHIHVEKPAGVVYEDFKELVDLAKKNNSILQTGYMYRYNPAIVRAHELVKQGEIGDVICMEAQMSQRYGKGGLDWLGTLPGGMMCYLGCHLTDLLYWFMGHPENVNILTTNSHTAGSDSPDFGLVTYKYQNGVSMLKTVACEVDGNMRRYLMISGTKGTIEITPIEDPLVHPVITNANKVTLKCTVNPESHPGTLYKQITTYEPYGRYDDMMVDFAKMVRGEKANPFTPDYELEAYKLFLQSVGVKYEENC